MATSEELIEAIKLKKLELVGKGKKSYSINGRSITNYDLSELEQMQRDEEQRQARASGPRRLPIKFQ